MTGEMVEAHLTAIERDWMGAPLAQTLDLDGLELEDGEACARMVDLIRCLCSHTRPVSIVAAPQMLAHVLYKIGALHHGQIKLVSPRMEDGVSVN